MSPVLERNESKLGPGWRNRGGGGREGIKPSHGVAARLQEVV